ncbi:UDP-2,3-diacylglucosamine hydrolase [Dysgonomonas sp. PH5-45]|uniref:UDP-2,3-diacylglucosamine diphosphatase n=1 Tax=unclassified Dysgonomonas TaxID=2630389 RepID=UPI0024738740|nr:MULTISPECIES: UDP-2,3-diacylglucosamine diphosphatase [unclassified Dysgonomonas]MDH6354010.1 UDP-2,3-diacylglucosamine hydrolase [Dysgonomonas sp. PH5-45]MDH6386912.1 UDP-2,3-diacylglucosamine hydrolase [Dysgonomonas sp. PH5-37]
MERTKTYFLSDVHLGSVLHAQRCDVGGKERTTLPNVKPSPAEYIPNHDIERKLCRWFDMVGKDAKTIYLLGDIFDYWFEYRNVVPRGFVRVLGKIAELTDKGVDIHFFIGNHDIWLTNYLANECGVIVHREPLVADINGQKFFMAHGDGLGDESKSFKLLRKIFHSKICRVPFAAIHPRWTVAFGNWWSNHNRTTGCNPPYMGEDKEHLVLFAKEHLQLAPNINYFVFGHRHIMLDLMLARSSRIVILGDWLNFFSYAVFDGETLLLEVFEQD